VKTEHEGGHSFIITVTILQARGLTPCDKSGLADGYCIVNVGKKSKKTQIIKRSLSPIWNESLTFNVGVMPLSVMVEVYDWNRFSQRALH
jgi:Ca2+-dependent lipid-binding protein